MESSLAPSFLDDDDDYDDEESIESLLPVDYDDEMQKYPDTGRVRCWRTSVTLTLLLTAIVVSLITYRFLMGKQIDTFETAVCERVGGRIHSQLMSFSTRNSPTRLFKE